MQVYRAYVASDHYVGTLTIVASSETNALTLLEDYTRVELLGRARIDLLLAAAATPPDHPEPDPEEYEYLPHLALFPQGTAQVNEESVTLDGVDPVTTATPSRERNNYADHQPDPD